MAPASTQRRVICVHPGSFMSAPLLDAGCGIRLDQQCAVHAVVACSAATCELAVRSRTRARAHSQRSLLNKALSTDAPTAAAARACRPGRVGVGCRWPDVERERRHVAQVLCSDHRIAAENPAATTKDQRATMSGRALPCRFCSWAHGHRTTRGGSGTRESNTSAPAFVRRTARKRQSSPCSFEERLTVEGRPRRLAAVCREKKDHTWYSTDDTS